MSKPTKYATLLLILTIPLLLFATGILKIPKSQKGGTTPSLPFTQTNQNQSQGIVSLPLDANNPEVTYFTLNYSFNGTVEQVTSDKEVVISFKNGTKITLPITDKTEIYKSSNGTKTNVPLSGLTQGTKVNITASFNVKLGKWYVFNMVVIL